MPQPASRQTDVPAADEAPPAEATPRSGLLDLLSPGEQLIGIGGAVIVAVDLVGDIVFDDYVVGSLLWLFGVVGVLAVFSHGVRGADIFLPYRWTLLIAGYGAGLTGLRGILFDIDNSILGLGGASVFFAILTAVAAAAMTLGALRLSRDDSV